MYDIQHCFICRPSDSTVSEDAGIELRRVATTTLADRRSNHSARSHPQLCKYNRKKHQIQLPYVNTGCINQILLKHHRVENRSPRMKDETVLNHTDVQNRSPRAKTEPVLNHFLLAPKTISNDSSTDHFDKNDKLPTNILQNQSP